MVEREHFPGTWQRDRSFSPAVTTKGGTMVWVAGHGAPMDDQGNSLAGNFDAQARQCFKNMQATLERTGAKLSDLVTMTVFITDSRFGDEFVRIRNEYFAQDEWPASAMITCDGLAQPAMMVEIQAIAVMED